MTKVKNGSISDLKYDNKNFNKHTEFGMSLLEKSLSRYGAGRSIVVDQNDRIIGGNGVVETAANIGMEDTIVVETTGDKIVVVKRVDVDIDTKQGREMALADNAVANANYNLDTALIQVAEQEYGIDASEYGVSLIDVMDGEADASEAKEDDFDEDKEPIMVRCKKGDIWQLGEHRLMCGDSTSKEHVKTLLNGERADMTFTDPPYNIDYKGVNDDRKIKNDKMPDDVFVEFLTKSIMKLDTAYVCCSWQYCHLFKQAMENLGMKPKAMIIWDKVNPAQYLDKYFKQHEIIWYFGKFGGQKTLRGDVWQCKRQVNTLHPTMKPIELIAMALSDQPDKKIVYDGFGGSGSTLIACEQLGRKARLMELDPHYCDVIIARWEKLTGKTAVKVEQ